MTNVILFDGVCNLCNSSVQFIIKKDPAAYFSFASLQGDVGKDLIKKYHIETNLDSVILIEKGMYYKKSDAALRICRHLNSGWKYLFLLKIIPRFIRDLFYDFIANHRYKWFGKKESCMLPTEDIKRRFL